MSYVHCVYLSWLRLQPDDATDVESTELFEFSEGMKFGVVSKAGFITRVAVLSYDTFLIITTLLGQVHNVFVFKGSNLLSVGEEGVLVRWQWKTHEQQFLPRLGAPIHHVAVSPDDSLTAISQKDNSECFITIAFTFVYICQLWLDMSPFQKIDYI